MGHDVGEIVSGKVLLSSLSCKEKVEYLKKHLVPGEKFPLCAQKIGKEGEKGHKTLRFQKAWLEKYKWLVYSPLIQGGLCKFCVLFPPTNPRITCGVLVTNSMQQIRKATGKDGYLARHEKLDYHKDALFRGNAASNSIDNPTSTLHYTLSVTNKEMYDNNMKILKFIVRTIVFCGKQNIALRGHRDDNTSTATNQGNFRALLQLLAESNAELHEHLESGKRNAQLTSKTVQNEIIDVIGDYI